MTMYAVPIERKVLDVYHVEARSGTDAAFKVATEIAAGATPTHTRELSRRVLSARSVVEDTSKIAGGE